MNFFKTICQVSFYLQKMSTKDRVDSRKIGEEIKLTKCPDWNFTYIAYVAISST